MHESEYAHGDIKGSNLLTGVVKHHEVYTQVQCVYNTYHIAYMVECLYIELQFTYSPEYAIKGTMYKLVIYIRYYTV